jgi:glycosyltransferase involved in cell wall biosynthesis
MLPPDSDSTISEQCPAASIVIPVHDGERTFERCLTAIFASQGISEFEVIVVDDGSTDASAAIASSFPCKLIRFEMSHGPSTARNRGVKEAKADRVVFVDSDVLVRSDSLIRLLAALESSPAVFGTYDPEPVNINFATLIYHTLSCQSLQDTSETTSVFYSYCAAIRRDLFLELCGFDTSFKRATFEDMEFGHRLASRGLYSKHLKTVMVSHVVSYDLSKLVQAYFQKSYDLGRLLLSHRSITFGDQGWTSRKNWAVLASAWGILIFGPLAWWANPLWAVPWTLAMGGFSAASAQLYRSMARRRWVYGPLSVAAYLGIHCIATSAMIAVALRQISNYLVSLAPTFTRGQTGQITIKSAAPMSDTGVDLQSIEGSPSPSSRHVESIRQ